MSETPIEKLKAIRIGPEVPLKMNIQTLFVVVGGIVAAVMWATTVHIQLDGVREDVAAIKQMLKAGKD